MTFARQPFEPSLKGRLAGVVGLGRSGLAAAKLLTRKGYRVFASDSRPRGEVRATAAGLPKTARWEAGGHSDRLLKCDFIVKSPGLKPDLPIFLKLRQRGVPIHSELEVALAFSPARELVVITGTNGKSTTTMLTYEIFKAGLSRGRQAVLGGNIGIAISASAPKARAQDALIVEASSYQLEDSGRLRPDAAAILNITADHLDHHGSMQAYVEAKARVFREQRPTDFCVFNADDALLVKLSRECPSRRLFFGAWSPSVHAWEADGRLRFKLPGWKKEMALVPPTLPGRHNLENAMAAGLLGFSRGISAAAIQKAFRSFKGVEHRIEDAGSVRGIECVNDSKATNVDSTLVALKAFAPRGKRVLLILGGLHKGSPYTPLKPWIEKAVKGILTIGSAARRIEEDLAGVVPIFPCGDLASAVDAGLRVGEKGDILLLSPACASFDQFANFEERGRRFKELVRMAAKRR